MSEMRQDEVAAKELFDAHMRRVSSADIVWRDGNQNEPPDFYLVVGDTEFIVEVTTLSEKLELPEGTIPIQTMYAWCEKFVKEIEKESQNRGTLTGTYYIGFPPVRKNVYRVHKRLRNKILDFIALTQSLTKIASTPIELDEVAFCRVTKTTKPSNQVSIGFYPPNTKWEIEAVEEATELLRSAVEVKAEKLKEFSQAKILLLISTYYYFDSELYRRIAHSIDMSSFHTIFLIDAFNLSQSYILHTEDSAWKRPEAIW